MKVDLAAQTLSASVADALEFLNSELKHPDFKNVESTILFIRIIDRLFDILNSRSPWAREYKSPMRENNEELWRPFLLDACQYLLDCTNISGRPLYCTPRKTPILGFVISTLSMIGIFDEFVKTQKLKYLLTYKCSQDHLEIFFCSVRSRNGWNNNPTCLQFMRTFRRLLLFSSVSERGGNCKVLDDTVVLKVPSTAQAKSNSYNIDVSLCRRYNLDVSNEIRDHDYMSVHFVEHNAFSVNVITYIGGYVIKMLKRIMKCPDCITGCILTDNDNIANLSSYKFLLHKNRGGLHVPSRGVVKICEATEQFIRRLMLFTNNRLPHENEFFSTFATTVAQKFYGNVEELSPDLLEHSYSFPPSEDHHLIMLTAILELEFLIWPKSIQKKFKEVLFEKH